MSKRFLYKINGKLEDNNIENFTNSHLVEYNNLKNKAYLRKIEIEKIEKQQKIKDEEIKRRQESKNCFIKHPFPRSCRNDRCRSDWGITIRKCQSINNEEKKLSDDLNLKIDEIKKSDSDRFWKLSKISEIRVYVNSLKNEYFIKYNSVKSSWTKKWITGNIKFYTTAIKKYYNKLLLDLQLLYSNPIDCDYKYDKCDSKCNSKLIINEKPDKEGSKCPTDDSIKCPQGVDDCPYTPINCKESYSKCQILNGNKVPDNFKGKCGKKNIIYENNKYKGKVCKNKHYILCIDGQGSCPKDCEGKWTDCDKFCKRKWITTKEAINGGKCIFKNKTQNCNPGEGNCEQNIDCEGNWSACINKNNKCVKKWNITKKEKGLGDKCRYRDKMEVPCNSCVIIPKKPDIIIKPTPIPGPKRTSTPIPDPVPIPTPDPVPIPTPDPVPVPLPTSDPVPDPIPLPKPMSKPKPTPPSTPASPIEEVKDNNMMLYSIIGILVVILIITSR